MKDQSESWSAAARIYGQEFVDPYLPEVRNPLQPALQALVRRGARTVADLGCGLGPLVPFLAEHFERVWAVDFAAAMLEQARSRCAAPNVTYLQRSLLDLKPLHGRLDVAVAVNSLVLPRVTDLDAALAEIRRCLKPDGAVLGIVPAMDAVHYQTMLLIERGLAHGQPLEAACKNAAHHNEHAAYDFALGQYCFRGIEQHFWQPFEVRFRFAKAGFRLTQLKKVHLAWKQFAGWRELARYAPPWDWFFLARRAGARAASAP